MWLALVSAVYLPACFYIALNLQGMFEGYLAPDPLMRAKDTFPVIVGYLGVLTAGYVGWGRLKRFAGARPSFPVFLYSAYLALLVLFYLDDRYEWGSKKGAHELLGLHNFFEAPALYGVSDEVNLVVFALFALPIYWVGRRTGLPVAQVAIAVCLILAVDVLAGAFMQALAALSPR